MLTSFRLNLLYSSIKPSRIPTLEGFLRLLPPVTPFTTYSAKVTAIYSVLIVTPSPVRRDRVDPSILVLVETRDRIQSERGFEWLSLSFESL